MEFSPIRTERRELRDAIGEISRGCGRFAIECSDVGGDGDVEGVGDRIAAQAELLGQLRQAATDLLGEQEHTNLKSDAPFVMETYRQDLGGGRYRPVKSVCLPLHIRGRRWGNLEFAYLD
ncbi:hypothetical protein [Sphingomonas sp. SRS2]|uniref:hypothetical protein n=1 Tax=Sphingomonas sp. SRS2 TaxID=133190 RepID=UPI0006184524|nr:hypothetical protein [Sphingomonas sp. SRS2]KKC24722.1 hypothetical protein WP12_18000 [Sphingomonas sp. SRS2]